MATAVRTTVYVMATGTGAENALMAFALGK
jgi:hypothetical protein